MKTGKTLAELAQEVMRQTEMKKDYIADTRALAMVHVPEVVESGRSAQVMLDGINGQPFPINDTAHGQLAQRLAIPKAYYDRMKSEAPALLTNNVNHWFQTQPDKRMVRTLDGRVRAFLSDRYRTLDNFDLLQAALPVLADMKVEFMSCEVTDRHMYLKIIFPDMVADVPGSALKAGDTVRGGLCLSNSEIGFSSLRAEPFIDRLVCTNGLISTFAMRKYHVGRGYEGESNVQEILRDETKEALDKGFWMKVQDVIRTAVTRDLFEKQVARFAEATQVKIEADPIQVVENVRKVFALSEGQAGGVLQHLLREGDLSKWGLVNAVTRTAEDQGDYEDATGLERLGGKIVELGQRDWASLMRVS